MLNLTNFDKGKEPFEQMKNIPIIKAKAK